MSASAYHDFDFQSLLNVLPNLQHLILPGMQQCHLSHDSVRYVDIYGADNWPQASLDCVVMHNSWLPALGVTRGVANHLVVLPGFLQDVCMPDSDFKTVIDIDGWTVTEDQF